MISRRLVMVQHMAQSVFQESLLFLCLSHQAWAWGLELHARIRAQVPNLQLLPLKNRLAYLLQTLLVVFPGFIKISSQCKLNGVQVAHERNMDLLFSLQVSGLVGWYFTKLEVISHTEPDHRMRIAVIMSNTAESFHLFDSSGQVLDKKPPEVVECLQLSGLCEVKEAQLRNNSSQTISEDC